MSIVCRLNIFLATRQPTEYNHLEVVDGAIPLRLAAVGAGVARLHERDLKHGPSLRPSSGRWLVEDGVAVQALGLSGGVAEDLHGAVVMYGDGGRMPVAGLSRCCIYLVV